MAIKIINLIRYKNIIANFGKHKQNIGNEEEENTRSKFIIKSIEDGIAVNDHVYLTSISSPRIIYVRNAKFNEDYEKLLDITEQIAKDALFLQNKPEVNEYVLAPYQKSFHRGKVFDLFEEDLNGFNCKIFLVDYGDEINVKWQDCKVLNYRLRSKKTFVIKCVLDEVKVTNNTNNAMKYLKYIKANNERLEILNLSSMCNRVILKRTNNEIVNKKINEMNIFDKLEDNLEPILYGVSKFYETPTEI